MLQWTSSIQYLKKIHQNIKDINLNLVMVFKTMKV